MMRLIFATLIMSVTIQVQAVEFKFSESIKANDRLILEKSLDKALSMLPEKFVKGLPQKITIKLKSYAGAASIPTSVCEAQDSNKDEKIKQFTYGEYQKLDHSLTLNKALLLELSQGEENSEEIPCQHKSLYNQAMASIIHEISHAYDSNSGSPSQTDAFRNVAGLGKFLTFDTKRNKEAMRSADEYEFKNSKEAFAVNMEYFSMDPEFACHRPVMFNFFKKLYGADPYPTRACSVNATVMVANQVGFIPVSVDPSRVYRVDYLMASNGSDMSSSFGHSMFRLIVCAPEHQDRTTGKTVAATPMGRKCLDDKFYHIIASFRANNQDATLDYMKGIFGGYPSMLFMLNFSEVIEQYNNAELRDLVSYPLLLSEQEKKDFLMRLVEDHWNYRGDYKFITNNCAVESLNTLQGIISEHDESHSFLSLPKITPNSMLKELVKTGLVNLKDSDIQTFKSSMKNMLAAYSQSYGGGKKVEAKDLLKFVAESKVEERLAKFQGKAQRGITSSSEKERLELTKALLGELASYSVIEQQVARHQVNDLQDKLADLTSQKDFAKKNPEIAKYFNQPKVVDIKDLATSGYGIPSAEELSKEDVIKGSRLEITFKESEAILKKLFPKEIKRLDAVASNLKEINKTSFSIREEYRKDIEIYLVHELEWLSKSDDGLALLMMAKDGSTENLRETLGKTVITSSEITNKKLEKLIIEILEQNI